MTGQKTGGRQVGTPNKTTSAIRQRLKEYFDDNLEGILDSIKDLPPSEKLQVFLKLLPYVTPQLKASERCDVEKTVLDIQFATGELKD